MRKFIKKILNLVGWTLLLLMLLFVALSIVINIPVVQDKITTKALIEVEAMFGNKISYDDVNLRLFNKAEFEGILIRDQSFDTLLYAKSFKVKIPGILRKVVIDPQIPVRLGALHLDEAYIRLYNDSLNVINLKFIADTIKGKKKSNKEPEPFFIDKITIENSRLDIHQFDSTGKGFGINLKRMTFNEFDLEVTDLRAFVDTVDMKIKNLSLIEQSGFALNKFSSDLHLTLQQLHFNKVLFSTRQSTMQFKQIHFDFNDYKDFGQGGIIDKIQLGIVCTKANLNLEELSYFARVFNGMDNNVKLAGNFYGTISSLNARSLNLSFGQDSYFLGSFDIVGLPNANSTFLIFDTDELNTTTDDLMAIKLPENKRITLPDKFKTISYYSYSGNFTGFFNDFVSYGTIETNLGKGSVDILFKPDSNNIVGFSGRVATSKFDVGTLVGIEDKIGTIKFNLVVDGKGTIDKGFDVNLNGEINEFEVNKYKYNAIVVDGNFSEKRFNGNFEINDPNLKMNFDGLLDLSSNIRQYNFTANVFNANLFDLNIHKKDPNYTSSFLIEANLAGNEIDDINGEVKLLNSLFTKSDAQIQVYDLGLKIRNDSLLNKLELKSDFFDGQISGHYKLSHLANEYLNLIDSYLPSLGLYQPKEVLLSNSDFTYTINFKNSAPLFAYFTPNYNVNPKTLIEGELRRGSSQAAKVHIESPKIRINKSEIENIVFNSSASDSIILVDFGCSKMNLSKRISLDNLTVLSTIDSNQLVFDSRWMNWDSTLNKGDLSGKVAFKNNPKEKLKAEFSIDSSVIVISDSVWALSPFNFIYDSSFVAVNNFKLAHNNEFFMAEGKLIDNTTDSLHFDFNNFNFGNLNFFTRSSTFKFGGILTGNATLLGFSKPLFFASLFVEELELNDELIGDTYIDTRWNNKKESVEINADVLRGTLKTLNIQGEYLPTKNNELDLVLDFNKFRLNFINPYLNTVFSDINGLATGTISLTGTGKRPTLNGSLNLQKAGLTVDYLQTRYNFTSEVAITNNNIVFDGVELFDKYINTATLNGIIRSEYLKNFNLNLSIQPQNFLCLNTTQDDNKSFFGRAFASGLIRINGSSSELKFDITATTEPGTEFSIPLSESEELADYNFIKIINTDTLTVSEEKEEYKVNLSGLQLDFDLNITPDAEVKIIFDPTLGDVITTRGEGDLRIAINSLGDFKMLGEYVIESGDYLFTLKDLLLNKKFKVEQGSYLQWTGDPVNANININTYYRTKAALKDLTGDPTSNTYRSTVDCQLGLTGKLKEPEVTYNIDLPFAEQSEKDVLSTKIRSNEEIGKQFLSLLVLNKFIYLGSEGGSSNFETSDLASVNASELLSNQLSNWLSQISDEVDIGVNYRPGTELSPQELELALSTQLLNDRLVINGSVDMKTNAEADDRDNKYLGNIDLDYKITRNGKFRARAYNRANDNEIVNYSRYTQGVGVFYTEEFDKVNEIGSWLRKNKDSNKKKRKKEKPKKEDATLRDEEVPVGEN